MKKKKINSTQCFKLIISTIILLCLQSCASTVISNKPIDLKFAVIGNTYPDSPFTGFTNELSTVMGNINEDNPIALFHTGNIIHGGMDWMGIKKEDIERQYKLFKKVSSKLNPIFHSVIGDKDLYNKTPILYQKYIRNKLNYSFNYGNIHFIIFNTLNIKFGTIQKYQLRWLKKDLDEHKKYSTIFIFTHSPIFSKKSSLSTEKTNIIHSLLKKYPVRAVFSGKEKRFYKTEKDKIEYINAGCSGFTKETKSWHHNQYYIVDYLDGKIKISPKKVR